MFCTFFRFVRVKHDTTTYYMNHGDGRVFVYYSGYKVSKSHHRCLVWPTQPPETAKYKATPTLCTDLPLDFRTVLYVYTVYICTAVHHKKY